MSQRVEVVSGGYEVIEGGIFLHVRALFPFGGKRDFPDNKEIIFARDLREDSFPVFEENFPLIRQRARAYAKEMGADYYELFIDQSIPGDNSLRKRGFAHFKGQVQMYIASND